MTQETSKVYDIAFRMGVLFNVLLFTALNLLTFLETRNNFHDLENSGIGAFPINGWNWGFPCPAFNYPDFQIYSVYLIINTGIYVLCGFMFGFLFKFVWSKISRRGAEFNGTPLS